jgi:hypothetical protein
MNLHQTDGAVESVVLVTIENITFENNNMVISTSEGVFRLPLEEISRVVFKRDANAGVEDVPTSNLQISLSGNQLFIVSNSAINAVYLVDVTGKMLVSEKFNGVSEVSMTLPQAGVFVIFLDTNQLLVTLMDLTLNYLIHIDIQMKTHI